MRLWSLHPKYLDRQGLTAVWREGLLAQAVLRGETKGYKNHPQLERFRATPDPLGAIGLFLAHIAEEATQRGYSFDRSKISLIRTLNINVTKGQITYEWLHLMKKLSQRSPDLHRRFSSITLPEQNPIFTVVPGEIESWEKL